MLRHPRAPLALVALLGLALAATFLFPASPPSVNVMHLAAWMFGAAG